MESLISILSVITPAVGVGCLATAIFKHRKRLEYLERSEVLEGVVIRLEEDKHDDTKRPHFSAVLPDGTTEEFRGKVASKPPRFAVGQRVKIFFSAEASPRFVVGETAELWLGVGVLYACGIFGILSPFPLILMRNYLMR